MKIIRLENSNFGFSSFREDEVNKVIEFDSESGLIKVHNLKSSFCVPFDSCANVVDNLLHFNKGGYKIIHNLPVINAYSMPFKIYLDIIQKCSLNCPFCLSDSQSLKDRFLSLDMIRRIAEEIKEKGVMYVKIGGGDPLLHNDFNSIVSVLHDAGCSLSISTNSQSITKEIAELLADFKVHTSVSIEGSETTDNKLRGVNHFQRSLNVMDILKSKGVDVLFRTTLLQQNLKDIPILVELAKSKKVKIKFSFCRPAGRALYNSSMLDIVDMSEYVKVLKYLNCKDVLPHVLLDEGMMFHHDPIIEKKLLRGRMCGAANRSMHIDAEGKVSPCIFLGPMFSFGKIYQDGNIQDFWRGQVGNKFQIVRSIRQPSECDNCDRLCKNECPSNRLYYWGEFQQQDPYCLYGVMKNVSKKGGLS